MNLYINAISVWAVGGVFYLQKMIVEVGAVGSTSSLGSILVIRGSEYKKYTQANFLI